MNPETGTCSPSVRVVVLFVALVAGTVVAGTVVAGDASESSSEHSRPRRGEVEPLLGVYLAGRETLTLSWRDEALVLDLDRISIPVDGRWPETVPTFAVRHRVSWLASRGVLSLEEQHNEGAHWRYELRFHQDRLDKVLPSRQAGVEATLVRSYRRQP